jgi:hypothetical protein
LPSTHPLCGLNRLQMRLTISRYGRVFVLALFIRLSTSIAKGCILSQQASCRVPVPPTLLPSSLTEPNSSFLLASVSLGA